MKDDEKPEVTPKQAAKALSVTSRTIFNYIKSGKLSSRKDGRRIFIPIDEIEKLRMENEDEKENFHLKVPETAISVDAISSQQDEIFMKGSINFQFDPAKHIVVERNHYEGLLTRLGQMESEVKLLKDERPWWKKLFGR